MSNNKVLWWIFLLLWMGASTYWHVCKVKELCYEQSASTVDVPIDMQLPPLKIVDGTALQLASDGNFGFAKSGAIPNMNSVQFELDSLSHYLVANPGKKVTITGYYSQAEVNSTNYPNLGIARAEEVKSYLVKGGLPDSTVATRGEQLESIQFSPDSMRGGIDFAFTTDLPGSEAELAASEKFESVFKPMDLYFSTGSSSFIHTSENGKFLKEAGKYLEDHKDKKLLLTGHADNTGDETINMELSRKRAQSVKEQFIKYGIPERQLLIDAKGELQPIESNDTEIGRKANRRVAIVVQ
jgi:OOP family OmpA-OmpF porin